MWLNDRGRVTGGLLANYHGELFTKGGTKDGGMGPGVDFRVFSRDGEYLRTIAPFPAHLAYDRVAPFGALRVSDTQYLPYMHHLREYGFYPASLAGPRLTQMAVSAEGYLFHLAGAARSGQPYICVFDSDGGVPAGWSFTGAGINTYDPKKPRGPQNPA